MSHSASKRPSQGPTESISTVRDRIAQALRAGELTAHEISQRAAVQERDVPEHLSHLEHSLRHCGERLKQSSPQCLKCGFDFAERERHGRPSRCPRCKGERIARPRFTIVPQ